MKLKKYKDGSVYVTGGAVSIEPNVDYEPEVIDVKGKPKDEIEKLKKKLEKKKWEKQ